MSLIKLIVKSQVNILVMPSQEIPIHRMVEAYQECQKLSNEANLPVRLLREGRQPREFKPGDT